MLLPAKIYIKPNFTHSSCDTPGIMQLLRDPSMQALRRMNHFDNLTRSYFWEECWDNA